MNEWEVVNELKNNNINTTNTKDDELKYILLKFTKHILEYTRHIIEYL